MDFRDCLGLPADGLATLRSYRMTRIQGRRWLILAALVVALSYVAGVDALWPETVMGVNR